MGEVYVISDDGGRAVGVREGRKRRNEGMKGEGVRNDRTSNSCNEKLTSLSTHPTIPADTVRCVMECQVRQRQRSSDRVYTGGKAYDVG